MRFRTRDTHIHIISLCFRGVGRFYTNNVDIIWFRIITDWTGLQF
ncbi:hypothetical protein L798_08983 [Zootermopsis nevadensis]|uniref:Uncharacterized protein n=1 Tax=Zootermopsis nevadensis TaxID=136037 RepID=A0A067RTM4_ZOONE|nr:hypothetical protein L798_08983 [Zootermopsis nevadensis]